MGSYAWMPLVSGSASLRAPGVSDVTAEELESQGDALCKADVVQRWCPIYGLQAVVKCNLGACWEL